MNQNQKNTICSFGAAILLSGAYMVLWLSRVWTYRPWPIQSNMINYGVVLLLFAGTFALARGVLFRRWPVQASALDVLDKRLQAGASRKVVAVGIGAAIAYLLYYVLYAVNTEMASAREIRTSLTDSRVIPLFYLLTILLFGMSTYCVLKGKDCSVRAVYVGYGVSAILYFCGLFLVDYFVADFHHGEAYVETIFNVADGVPFEELTTGIYGHYGLFFLLPMKLFGAKPLVVQVLIALVGVATDAALLYGVHHLVSKNWARLLFALAIPAIPFAYRQTNYWQLQPHRLVFPALLAAYVLAVVRRQKKLEPGSAAFWGGWLICMLAVLWNTESGLFCIAGLCAGCVVEWWQNSKWYAVCQWKRYAAMLLGAALAVLGAIGLTNLYNLACGGAPIFKVFFYPLYSSCYMNDDIGYPIRLAVRPWLFILLLFLALLAWALSHTAAISGPDSEKKTLLPYVGCLSTLGLVSFSYYANRAAWLNMEVSVPEFLLCLCLPVQALAETTFGAKVRGLKSTIVDTAGAIAVLILCVFAAQLPGGVVNTAELWKLGAFSTQGITAELENFSTHVPDNTFAVGQGIGTIYHAAGWNNYGHYVDVADYGVADPDKLKAQILKDLQEQPGFLLDETVQEYLLNSETGNFELPGYELQSTFSSAETIFYAGKWQNISYYYYVKQ